MYIVSEATDEYGRRNAVQTFNGANPPNGFVIYPFEELNTFYMPGKLYSGFVTFDVVNGVATNIEWNEEAYQAYIESIPDPEPQPEPMTQAEIEEMLLDQEYRILLLEYGMEEEEE